MINLIFLIYLTLNNYSVLRQRGRSQVIMV